MSVVAGCPHASLARQVLAAQPKRPNGESFSDLQLDDTMGSATDQALPVPLSRQGMKGGEADAEASKEGTLDLSPIQNGEGPVPGCPRLWVQSLADLGPRLITIGGAAFGCPPPPCLLFDVSGSAWSLRNGDPETTILTPPPSDSAAFLCSPSRYPTD